MKVKITAIHFNTDSKLEMFIEEKVSKLGVFSDDILGADVHLSLEKSQTKNFDSKVVKVRLDVPGYDLFSEKKSGSFEEGVDACVTALKSQLQKRKEKKR